jgi:PIN domain nuclease of toxin-antitoxin system
VYVSSVSILEIVIKVATGKLTVPDIMFGSLEACRFGELPLTVAHANAIRELPAIHKDPFDRALVAQSRVENLTLVSRDPLMDRYGVSILPA